MIDAEVLSKLQAAIGIGAWWFACGCAACWIDGHWKKDDWISFILATIAVIVGFFIGFLIQ